MNNKTLKQTLGIAAFFAAGLMATADLVINPALLGVAISFIAAGLILAFATLEERKNAD